MVDVARPCGGVRNHPVHYLCLANSFLDDTKRVASILFGTLAALKQVDTLCWDESPLCYLPESETQWVIWEEVNHHLWELRKCPDLDRGPAQVVLQPTA
ncbi:hypothetical protein OG21DRAFT_1513521 [Imleria badia]|nr:hypothetical protein OG21DRAFT_1513521 [Imleria badia]